MTRRKRRARPDALEVQLRSELGLAPVEQLELLEQAQPPAAAGAATNVSENRPREGAAQPTRRSS